MIRNLLNNWKTTSAGVAAIVGAGVHLTFAIKNHTADESTWTTSLLSIATGVGLLAAGDAATSVTKQEADTTFVKKEEQ